MRRASRIGWAGLWALAATLGLGRAAAAQDAPGQPAPRAGEDAVGYDEPKLERRRPRLSGAIAPGRDLTLEADLEFPGGFAVGDAHKGLHVDYEDAFSIATGVGLRFALPMRWAKRGTSSFWSGPVIYLDTLQFDGDVVTILPPANDALRFDDMRMNRLMFGGLFRIEFRRGFVEAWLLAGVAHTSRTNAQWDQSPSGGPITPFTIYDRTTVGAFSTGIRGGWSWHPAERVSLQLWGSLGFWATGAPDAATGSPFAMATDPGGMRGPVVAIGFTVGFGLGDFGQGPPSPARREPVRRIPTFH